MSISSGQTITAEFTLCTVAGVGSDADTLPTGTLVVSGTDNGASVTVSHVDTGRYKFSVTLPTLAIGNICEVVIAATVGGTAAKKVAWRDIKDLLIDSAGGVNAGLSVYGKKLYYVATTGSDSNDGLSFATAWLTVYHATQTATGPSTVKIGPGTFNEGATHQMTWPDGVSVCGAGWYATIVEVPYVWPNSSGSPGVCWKVGSHSTHESMTLDFRSGANTYSLGIGCGQSTSSNDTAFTDATMRDLQVYGDSDCFYFGDGGTLCTGRVENCTANGSFDTFNNNGSGNIIEVLNCRFLAVGPNLQTGVLTRALVSQGGTGTVTRAWDSTFIAQSGGGATYGAALVQGGSRLELYNCKVSASDTGGLVYDLNNLGGGTATLLVRDTAYVTSNGTITVANTPINGAAQIAQAAFPANPPTGFLVTASYSTAPAWYSAPPTATVVADTTLRRKMSNVQDSGSGDALDEHSLYGMVQIRGQNSSLSGTTLTVKNPDNTTLGTFTVTVSAGADPMTGITG